MKQLRPWGYFQVLINKLDFVKKLLVIYPGHRFSLQFHNGREEHWTILQGEGIVTLGSTKKFVSVGDIIDIPQGMIHRLENTGEEYLKIEETWTGKTLLEEDIVRLDDDYNRS